MAADRSRPWSYPCINTIVKSMNDAKRIQLTKIMKLPLTLDSLEVGDFSIKANNVEYHLERVRFDLVDGKLKPQMENGRKRGFYSDVDKCGIELKNEDLSKMEQDDWLRLKSFEFTLRCNELTVQYGIFHPESPLLTQKKEDLEWKILDFQKYDLKRRNEEPTFQYFVHFVIRDEDRETKSEIINYDHTFLLKDAQKYIWEKVLSGRSLISVNKLKITTEDFELIPEDLKMEVKHLDFSTRNRETSLENLKPFLAPSSFPLESVILWNVCPGDKEFLSQVNEIQVYEKTFLPDLVTLPYKRMRLSQMTETIDQVVALADVWRSSKREIGTHYTFACYESRLREKMEIFKNLHGARSGTRVDQRTTDQLQYVFLPIDEKSELKISESNEIIEIPFQLTIPFQLEMEVVARK